MKFKNLLTILLLCVVIAFNSNVFAVETQRTESENEIIQTTGTIPNDEHIDNYNGEVSIISENVDADDIMKVSAYEQEDNIVDNWKFIYTIELSIILVILIFICLFAIVKNRNKEDNKNTEVKNKE